MLPQPRYTSRHSSPHPNVVRVLHIVESLDNQAVETWLLRVLRETRTDFPQIDSTFFCVLSESGQHDEAARALGIDVIHSQYELSDKVRFMRSLRQVMAAGKYDVLHCHHDVMSAVYLVASAGLPIRKRIIHVHNTSLSLPTSSRIKSQLIRGPMRRVCLRMADQIVGISQDALDSLAGNGALDPSRKRIVHYAIDTARFTQASLQRGTLRSNLGLKSRAKILLFLGRLVEYKNPTFVLDILELLVKTDEDIVAVFAGTGVQETLLAQMAKRKSLEDHVRFLGFRNDVPELMANSDLLIWPSLEDPKEGLGLGIVEAQAAGLPVLMSRSVPREAIVVSELVEVLPLSAGTKKWAEMVASIIRRPRPDRLMSQRRVETSSFSMKAGVANLMALYDLDQAAGKP